MEAAVDSSWLSLCYLEHAVASFAPFGRLQDMHSLHDLGYWIPGLLQSSNAFCTLHRLLYALRLHIRCRFRSATALPFSLLDDVVVLASIFAGMLSQHCNGAHC